MFYEYVFIKPFRHGQNVTPGRFCIFVKIVVVCTDMLLYEYVFIQYFRRV